MGRTIIDILAKHDPWATRELLRICRTLSREQFTQRFEIGPGSLHDTLRHVIGAMHRWADRIGDREVRASIEAQSREWTADELEEQLDIASHDLHEVVARVRTEKRNHETMELHTPRMNETIRFTRGDAIVHVYTHGMHHRAQAMNMLRQLGIDPPHLSAIDAAMAVNHDRATPSP